MYRQVDKMAGSYPSIWHFCRAPPCFTDEYQDLVSLQLLLVIEDLNSPHPYGLPSAP